ncbi:MAG: 16S rRNA (cytosine(1402)-N(4))-methyltransferase RsmH [Chloroflexi bacterium]|nr:16S rRNA (cytosine(1402)-N(4))-methyltransferase RsmH [Chloroflexota bacterium]MBL7061741.1 16S rRNA (cytosine(1402)-N(4))-methyltransferase RsmH [Dehalococcoidia bacterium]
MTIPIHKPVLLSKAVEALQAQHGKRYVDCTLGSGGHASAILEKILPDGQLLGIDADPEAINMAKTRLADYTGSTIIINDNFANLETICRENNFLPVHGILFDLGLSSTQLEVSERGFSFQHDGPLDMRFSPIQELTAADIVNNLHEDKLSQIIKTYGEERYSKRIARYIIKNRPISSTLQLASVVEKAIGSRHGKIHPATRTFMALRIAANRELENLAIALKQTVNCLDHRGRLVVISYHSLEDRIVKQFMIRESKGCICPSDTPICQCGHIPSLKIVSKKAITPSLTEIKLNSRSRSAKLRVAERLL